MKKANLPHLFKNTIYQKTIKALKDVNEVIFLDLNIFSIRMTSFYTELLRFVSFKPNNEIQVLIHISICEILFTYLD